VQSVALASFGLEIDRRVVSVVQLDADDEETPETSVGGFRPSIVGITAESSGLRTLVRVALEHRGQEAVGFAEGSVASTARHRLVAVSTIDALRQLQSAAESVDIDS